MRKNIKTSQVAVAIVGLENFSGSGVSQSTKWPGRTVDVAAKAHIYARCPFGKKKEVTLEDT